MVKEGLINLDFADVRSVMREMGRAMMGTGEASGEGRAMAAAEAAIANPLLDETTMKGAQGLLISITGGRDMTLFEVDEAATRIREEVDADANIILGATFDEELEGLIRVSVVATGIDRDQNAMEPRHQVSPARAAAVARPATISAPVSRPAMPQPAMQQPQAAAASIPAPQAMPAIDPVAETIRAAEAQMEAELDIAARAAISAQAPSAPRLPEFEPQSRIFSAPPAQQPRPAMAQPQPAPVQHHEPAPMPQPAAMAPQPQMRTEPDMVRMPRVEDFPPVVQAEMEQRHQPQAQAGDERGPMGLLKRLSHSLGMREDEAEAKSAAAPQPQAQPRRPISSEASVYAPRRGQLDDQGRAVPQTQMSHNDDQLEIPAFLRRQVK
jgi:cell division protein FtsZ